MLAPDAGLVVVSEPVLTGRVELPESLFQVLVQVAAAMKAGLAVTVAPHHLHDADADPEEVKAALTAARKNTEI